MVEPIMPITNRWTKNPATGLLRKALRRRAFYLRMHDPCITRLGIELGARERQARSA